MNPSFVSVWRCFAFSTNMFRHQNLFSFFFVVSYNHVFFNLFLLCNTNIIAAYLTGLDLPKEELDASIIGTIGDMDGPMPADTKGWTSLRRHLMGHTDATRQRFRDEVK